jgi:hypothetical protein
MSDDDCQIFMFLVEENNDFAEIRKQRHWSIFATIHCLLDSGKIREHAHVISGFRKHFQDHRRLSEQVI